MVKNLPAGDLSSISGLGRSPGEGKDNPLQYSFLEDPTDRGAWWATVHGVAKMQAPLSNWHFHFTFMIVDDAWSPFNSNTPTYTCASVWPLSRQLSCWLDRYPMFYLPHPGLLLTSLCRQWLGVMSVWFTNRFHVSSIRPRTQQPQFTLTEGMSFPWCLFIAFPGGWSCLWVCEASCDLRNAWTGCPEPPFLPHLLQLGSHSASWTTNSGWGNCPWLQLLPPTWLLESSGELRKCQSLDPLQSNLPRKF